MTITKDTRDPAADRELGVMYLEQAAAMLAAASSRIGTAAHYLEWAGNDTAPETLSAEIVELRLLTERLTQVAA